MSYYSSLHSTNTINKSSNNINSTVFDKQRQDLIQQQRENNILDTTMYNNNNNTNHNLNNNNQNNIQIQQQQQQYNQINPNQANPNNINTNNMNNNNNNTYINTQGTNNQDVEEGILKRSFRRAVSENLDQLPEMYSRKIKFNKNCLHVSTLLVFGLSMTQERKLALLSTKGRVGLCFGIISYFVMSSNYVSRINNIEFDKAYTYMFKDKNTMQIKKEINDLLKVKVKVLH